MKNLLFGVLIAVSFQGLLLGAPAEGAFGRLDDEERFQWRGQVDGVDEILIRGRSVRVRHLEAKPIQRQDYRFSAPLPKREVDLKLHEIEGRGKVRLVEEPGPWNDYTAVVRIDDGDKGGDDYYEFELVWRVRDKWDKWNDDDKWDDEDEWDNDDRDDFDDWDGEEGAFRWEGRVDIGAEIEIRDDQHRVEDMGGEGTEEYRARFDSKLPRRNLPVSLRKVEGRGRVELIQTPDADNDYTAIVKIEDPKSGADTYEFELTWRRR